MASNQRVQVLAKSLTFIMLAGLAFLVGRGGITASVVGDFEGTNKPLGVAILAVTVVGVVVLYFKYQRTKN